MPHHIDDILGIIFHGEFARFEPFTEASGNIRYTRVSRVAVDICLDTATANEHIPVTAGSTGKSGQVRDSLSQDFIDGCIRFTVSRKTTQCKMVTTVDILCNSVF